MGHGAHTHTQRTPCDGQIDNDHTHTYTQLGLQSAISTTTRSNTRFINANRIARNNGLLVYYVPPSMQTPWTPEPSLCESRTARRPTRYIYVYKILNGQVAVPAELIDLELSVRTSRGDYNQQKLYKPRTHTIEYQKSFVYRTIPCRVELFSFISCSVRHSIYLQVSALRSSVHVERNHSSL